MKSSEGNLSLEFIVNGTENKTNTLILRKKKSFCGGGVSDNNTCSMLKRFFLDITS